jgi:peroxiredoxin
VSGKAARAKRKNAPAAKAKQATVQAPHQRASESSRLPRLALTSVGIVAAAIVGLYFLSSSHNGGKGGAANTGSYPYAVGSPGVGAAAPNVKLPSTGGGTFNLASYRGKEPVLLYFQEGLTCQPCWDQISAIEKVMPEFRALGIATIVSITTDPIGDITQKAHDEGFSIPVLSDQGGRVSDTYSARNYGMMGHDRDGHSFVLVGRNGKILWRADYGGAPKYTMFVPVDVLLAQLKAGAGGKV